MKSSLIFWSSINARLPSRLARSNVRSMCSDPRLSLERSWTMKLPSFCDDFTQVWYRSRSCRYFQRESTCAKTIFIRIRTLVSSMHLPKILGVSFLKWQLRGGPSQGHQLLPGGRVQHFLWFRHVTVKKLQHLDRGGMDTERKRMKRIDPCMVWAVKQAANRSEMLTLTTWRVCM